jgi:ribonuclease P protein subunit RPR2
VQGAAKLVNATTKQIARHRIQILFEQATETYQTNPDLATTYLLTAKKIAMAARVRLPESYKRRICKSCSALLVPGKSSRVRIKSKREPHVVITCLKCGNVTRMPLKPKIKEKTGNEQDNNQDEAPR